MKGKEKVDLKMKEAREMTYYLSTFTNEKVRLTMLPDGKKEMKVESIARVLNMPQSSVSLHLENYLPAV